MFDIVMPLYNKGEFVEATIASVLAQTHGDWHLFVVDDGSSDGGADLVGHDDPRLTLIRQNNQGVGPARNAGIRAGSAAWIAFLDADDVWNADHLAELHALGSEFPEAVLAGCRYARFSGTASPKKASPGGHRRRLANYFAEGARGRDMLITSSVAVRRAAVEEVGDFQPLPGNEDVELWARLALHGPVAVSSKRTVNYRVATGGLTDRGNSQGLKPMKREELSSTIPLLTRRLADIADPMQRRDVIEYMDARVGIRMVAAALDGDFVYVRHLASLCEGRPRGKARVAAIIARLPAWLAIRMVRSGRSLKRAMRMVSSG